MDHIFDLPEGVTVPDGTRVHEILGLNRASELARRWSDNGSIALGDLPPGTISKIHLHPIVQQFAWVLEGTLEVVMKDPHTTHPYRLRVPAQHGVMTEPHTFFQLHNPSNATCKVLYVVTPVFVFETDDSGNVIYNDAVVFDQDWPQLQECGWATELLDHQETIMTARAAALNRLRT